MFAPFHSSANSLLFISLTILSQCQSYEMVKDTQNFTLCSYQARMARFAARPVGSPNCILLSPLLLLLESLQVQSIPSPPSFGWRTVPIKSHLSKKPPPLSALPSTPPSLFLLTPLLLIFSCHSHFFGPSMQWTAFLTVRVPHQMNWKRGSGRKKGRCPTARKVARWCKLKKNSGGREKDGNCHRCAEVGEKEGS